ncbi:MAG: hypothetical protein Q9O24_03585 [Gammaproteobacteria bacterium]|nr:hypothetical protein [Gammaproteobacteria bacterium]
MKRILIYLMLLSTLSSGLAFAWDTHPEAMVGHDSVALDLLLDTDTSLNDSNDTHLDDHCCHASAHLLAMLVPHAPSNRHHSAPSHLHPTQATSLRYIAPLLRPPIH